MDKEELIIRYLNNSLTEKEQKTFDELIQIDKEFKKDVAFQQSLKKVIAKEEYNSLKTHLQSLEKQPSTSNYKKWLVAASIIILVGFSGYWFLNSSVNSQDLYAQNFEPYRNVIKPIARGEMGDDTKILAFAAYETKNYTKALNLFNTLLSKKEKDNDIVNFYKANTLLQLNKVDEAIVIFKQNIATNTSWKDKNLWYLTLAYLKNNDIENAKKQLKILAEIPNNTFKKKKVKDLLEALDNF